MILIALSEAIFEKLKPFLEELKVKYQKVENGEELLEKAKKLKPDLILLEKDLPLLDGFAVALLLKSDNKTKNIPIIAVCKCNFPEEEIKAKDSGVDTLLYLPFNREQIIESIKGYLK
ncbi:MAG: PleD family two-component system response regulator [Caldimicrobium sp.]